MGSSTIYLGTDQSVGNNDFLGLGTSSANFPRNTLVIAQDSTIIGLSFSIRDNALGAAETASGEVYVSTDCAVTPVATGIIATVTGPNPPNCCAFASGSFAVAQCDLITVRVTTPGNAFAEGVAATIIFSIP